MFHYGQVFLLSGTSAYDDIVVDTTAETGARHRTRRAILDAATRALAADPQAPLGEIAEAADVGRTTLHRYFPERSDLIAALGQDATARLDVALTRARLTESLAVDALVRLCHEYLELGDLLNLIFTGVCIPEDADADATADAAMKALTERGHTDGSLDPDMTADWIVNVLWALLYTSWEVLGRGGSRREVVGLAERTLRKAVAGPGVAAAPISGEQGQGR